MSKQLLISLLNCSWQWVLLGSITWFVSSRLRRANTTVHLLWLFSLISLPILFGLNQIVPAISIKTVQSELTPAQPELAPAQPIDISSPVLPILEVLDLSAVGNPARAENHRGVSKPRGRNEGVRNPARAENHMVTDRGFLTNWSVLDGLLCAWAIGVLLMLARLGAGLYRISQLRRTATVADDSYYAVCRRLVQHLPSHSKFKVNRPVSVYISNQIVSPISFGWLSPCILLPETLRPAQIELVLAHELAHVQRLDWLTNLFSHAVGAIFFFHPFYHFLNRRMADLRERICDDWVIQLTGARKNYAQCLLDIVRHKDKTIPLALSLNQPSRLESRIDSILENNRRLDLQPKRRLLVAAGTLLLTSLPLLAMAQLVPIQTAQLSLFSRTTQKSEKAVDVTEKKSEETHIVNKIEETYNVKPRGSLKVVSEYGSISLQTADRDTVEIVITKGSEFRLNEWGQKALADFEVTFEHEDSDVYIEGIFKRGRKYWEKNRNELNRLKIHFQVTVPQQYNVDLDTSSGNISVVDLNGEVRVQTSGGSLHFNNIKGPVWGCTAGGSIKLTLCDNSNSVLKALGLMSPSRDNSINLKTSGGSVEAYDVSGTVKIQTSGGSFHFSKIQGSLWAKTSGGSINLEEFKGNADVHTSGGSITLENVSGVTAKTSGGSIRATMTTQYQQACRLHTSGGGIVVVLSPDIAVDVEAQTSGSGHVLSDFPVASVIQGKAPKNRLRGTINGGGPLLKLRTSGADIHLQRAEK